jgi:glycosyltransferase involved in cell wall biosynthesis
MPRVSVIIPVFNSERYLAEAVESILTQTFRDFEVLLLDDGSTDGSVTIAQQLAARDGRVRLINGGHHGVVHWRNVGLNEAKGEYVAMMDSDDVAVAERLARQVEFLDANPECGAVGAQAVRIDPDGDAIDFWRVPESHEEIDASNMREGCSAIINPSVLMRTSTVRAVGGYRAGFDSSEDYDLFLRLAEVARLANLPDVLLRYRLHAKSLTLGHGQTQNLLARKAQEEAWVRRKNPGEPPPRQHFPPCMTAEELIGSWALSAFAARHFKTARKHAFRLVRKRPSEFKRWVLLGAAWLGPVALPLRRVCSYRVGRIS